MRTITTIRANDDWTLDVAFNDGVQRRFDVKPFYRSHAPAWERSLRRSSVPSRNTSNQEPPWQEAATS
jgi:hypothetical protein